VEHEAPASPAADVFALGVLFWELWFRHAPHSGRSPAEVATAVACGERLPLGAVAGLVEAPPQPLRALIAACWAQDPRERPAAAKALGCFTDEVAPALLRGGGGGGSSSGAHGGEHGERGGNGGNGGSGGGVARGAGRAGGALLDLGSIQGFAAALPPASQARGPRSPAMSPEGEAPPVAPPAGMDPEMARFLLSAGLFRHAATLADLGYGDMEMLADAEILGDGVLKDEVGMSKFDVRKLRAELAAYEAELAGAGAPSGRRGSVGAGGGAPASRGRWRAAQARRQSSSSSPRPLSPSEARGGSRSLSRSASGLGEEGFTTAEEKERRKIKFGTQI
jgi:hypothetical protein